MDGGMHVQTGGNFARPEDFVHRLPPPATVYLEAAAVESLARQLANGKTLDAALRAELSNPQHRVVRYAPLDVHFDAALHVMAIGDEFSARRRGTNRHRLAPNFCTF